MTKLTKQEQSGRSMVEMLGVLAVMGVLSIGGVAGYKLAMDKHRANEFLHELTLRANEISRQLLKDINTEVNLSEFSSAMEGFPDCELSAETIPSEEVFKIKITNLPEDICRQLLSQVGGSSIVRATIPSSCSSGLNTVEFLFNHDLSTDVIEVLDEGEGEAIEEEEEAGGTCITNADCKNSNQYCALKRKDGKSNACENNSIGECTTKSSGEKTFIFYGSPGFIEINGKKFYQSSDKMTWWSAKNYCEKFHKKLISLSDFGISGTTGKGAGYFGDYCGSTTCIFSDGYTWNKRLVQSPGQTSYSSLSKLDSWWTENQPSGVTCQAYTIEFVYSEVNKNAIHYSPGAGYAACID